MGWKTIVTAPWSISSRTSRAPETKWRLSGAGPDERALVVARSSSSGRSRATRNS